MSRNLSIASIGLSCKSLALLEECIKFYEKLGFQVVERRPTEGGKVIKVQEAYLHYFSAIGADIHLQVVPDLNMDGCAAASYSLMIPSSLTDYIEMLPKELQEGGRKGELVDPIGSKVYLVEKGRFEQKPEQKVGPTVDSSSATANPTILPDEPTATGLSKIIGVSKDDAHPLSFTNLIKKKIGVLTSGGDSCGMNASVRAITRVALQRGCVPFAIYEGYQGLVDGGDKIKELKWDDVRGYLSKGGTLIGTARCASFRTREGRLDACFNLIKNGIDALVIIGGDGSLTGADTFRAEWTGLVDELIAKKRITDVECKHLRDDLSIVGLVGSIDNDMSCTDITIGAVTSLHRICESVDSLVSTAQSHQRAFVVEVMGRHCGWLALMAAIAVGADCVFLPERPPPLNQSLYGKNWEQEMCDIVFKNRASGNRKTLVIVAEGAIDSDLNPIKPESVKKVLEKNLGLDTRVTTLGHVQRGGSTCAFDRYLATVQGVEAVDAVLRSTRDTPAPMIGMAHNEIISIPLMEAVKKTQEVTAAIARKDFAKAMELRDPDFNSSYDAYIESSMLSARTSHTIGQKERLRIGILHCGAPAGGMNAATRVIARLSHSRGHIPLGIKNGFSGLVNDEVAVLQWEDVRGWQTVGGTQLGTNRDHPTPIPGSIITKPVGVDSMVDTGAIAFHLQKNDIQALIIIGGFEAFSAQLTLTEARKLFPALCIPMCHIPATISNNIPATDFSVGSDTALNVIVSACDSIRLSANASRKRVFVVETHGGNCGYLATLSALTVGATSSYIPEEKLTLDQLQTDVKHLVRRYTEEIKAGISNEGRVILRSESTEPAVYSTQFISGMLRAEGKGLFDSRETVLGHLQQGDTPSPLDRIRATRLAVHSVDWLQKIMVDIRMEAEAARVEASNGISGVSVPPFSSFTTNPMHSCVVGFRGSAICTTPVKEALLESDMVRRTTKKPWWYSLRALIRVLGKREYQDDI